MLTSLTRFTVYFALSLSVLGAPIPAPSVSTAVATSTDARFNEASGALWKNNVHDKVYSSEAPATTSTIEGNLSITMSYEPFTDIHSIEQFDVQERFGRGENTKR
jgi:hypothetical protein